MSCGVLRNFAFWPACMIFAVLSAIPLHAQQEDPLLPHWTRGVAPDYGYRDYYETSTDPKLWDFLQTVERAHFHKRNFWMQYASQNWEYAIQELQYVTMMFPNHPQALIMLGSIAHLTDQPSFPLPYFQRAFQLYPQHGETYFLYGEYLLRIDRVAEAIDALKHSVALDPGLAAGHAHLAKAYTRANKPDLAQKAADTARKLGYEGVDIDAGSPDGKGKPQPSSKKP